eukprot:8720910-Ditylum_brightwellii.AAC.1
MARSKRRVNVRSQSQQVKKSRTPDHMIDDDVMDLDHSAVGENVMEKLKKSKSDLTDDDDDGSDDAGKKGGKRNKKNDEDDDDDSNNSSNYDNDDDD